MTRATTFDWHPHAAVCLGSDILSAVAFGAQQGFRVIHDDGSHQALEDLCSAIKARAPFCVTDRTQDGLSAEQGELLTFTGGSTGAPKVICRSQASWIASFEVNAGLFGFEPGMRVATLGALSHSLTLYAVVEAIHLGLSAHVLAGLSATTQRRILDQKAVQILYTTPTQLKHLASGDPKTALQHIRFILCGGGMLDEATRQIARRLCPHATLHQFYGAAETSFVTLTDADTPAGSVGKAYPNVTLDLREGQVWVRSPYLFKGYANKHDALLRDADGYVSVGELGTMDAQGNLWLTGRKDRLVQIADQTVSPEAVEQVIAALCGSRHVAVLPVADAARGYRLVAVLEGHADDTLAAKIRATCQASFGSQIAPRRMLFRAEWPLLGSGKTDLARLSQWLETRT